ncbi:group 1 glycosyl transferase [Bacillus freudenreichii]|nr:group 1 glycosyl transferase [Bacillus freudenreichii]
MRKKSIVFMLINMNIGGTEKALLNMIAEMPRDQFDITILLLEKHGGFLDSIPDDVKVDYFNGYRDLKGLLNTPLHKSVLKYFRAGKIIRAFIFGILYIISKIRKESSLLYKYVLRNYPVIEKEYDIAVAYAGPMEFISYFVIHKIKAKKKIQWIHFDVTKIGFNKTFAEKIYQKFDNILVVSDEAKAKLINDLPSLKERTAVFHNMISPSTVRLQANDGNGFTDRFDGLRILTVGRLSHEKGQDLAIRVFSRLISEGLNAKWYCLGEGKARQLYESLIAKHHLENHFILLGQDINPYPYIKQCDIYVQPSRYEGYCITVLEAKCLNKPIITTNFNGAEEQIIHDENGFIVPFDEHEMYSSLKKLMKEKEIRKKLSNNLSKETMDFGTNITGAFG